MLSSFSSAPHSPPPSVKTLATGSTLSVSQIYKNVSRVLSPGFLTGSQVHHIRNWTCQPPNTHTTQPKLSFLPPSFSLGQCNHHIPWKHESLPPLIQLSHLHMPVPADGSQSSPREWRSRGQLSSKAHPASPPVFHKDRFANLTYPRMESNCLIWDKRILQFHPPLYHSSLFKSLSPGALSLTNSVTPGKILNLSGLPLQTGDNNSRIFLIGYQNVRCANIHKILEQCLAHSKCCAFLLVLWFPAYPYQPPLSPMHTNMQACCPHTTTNSVPSPKHIVWAISYLYNFVLTSLVDFPNSHIPQDLAQILLLLCNFSSYPKSFPHGDPTVPQMNFQSITSMNYF